MRIVLISTPTRTYTPNIIMPLGIMYLASYLEGIGHTVKIIDVAKTRQDNQTIIAYLTEFKPDLIGISGIITAFRFIKILVRDLKKTFPKIPIVIGGHTVLDISNILISNIGCDYTISGYGEKPLAYLVEYLEKKRKIENIPGLSYLKNRVVARNPGSIFFNNMDDIPLPAYHQIDMEYYVTAFKILPRLKPYLVKSGKPAPPLRWAPVIAARGCTDKCAFCVHEFEYKGLHIHTIEYIINNVRFLYEKYNVRIFGFGEDLFLYNVRQARELVNAMNLNFPDAYFSCSSRADCITQEIVDVLKDSNCFYIAYGFESGSNTMLKILNKRTIRDVNIAAYKIISKTNITPACSFMIGAPGETRETVNETISAIKEADIASGAVFIATPYPGSRLFRWSIEQGLINDVESYLNFISNRDAFKLSVNFTAYPNAIVRIMRVLVQNACEKNKRKKGFKLRFIKIVAYHWMLPVLYESYFFMRNILAIFFRRYRNNAIDNKLNKQPTLMLATDKE